MWLLAFGVFFSATFVQLHHIEHISDSVHKHSHAAINATNFKKAPLDLIVDQCDICTQCSNLNHVYFIVDVINDIQLYKSRVVKIDYALSFVLLSTWHPSQPRAPPALFIS